LPVHLFALSQSTQIIWSKAFLVFIILHVLVYPSSNGYNSYIDRDETAIGGLSNPLQPTRQLFYVSIGMDVLAIVLSFFISFQFALGILLYITASRAYSYKGVRLKRYPIAGFLTVFICQGALVFWLTYHGVHPHNTMQVPLLPCFTSSLLIGALYPLTQVYQHEADKRDGVTTISILLGKRGSFLFSMALFLSATAAVFYLFRDHTNFFYLFLLMLLPVVLFFLYWMREVWQDASAADFKHSLWMYILSTICTTAFFITLIVLNH